MAWGGSNWRDKGSNYSTAPGEMQSEDTFISEMLQEFGKFNQDFFIMKMMSKAIDSIGTDPQKYILLMDVLEQSLINSGRLDEEYSQDINTKLKDFETSDGKEPNDMLRKLEWKTKIAGIKFSIIFGKLARTQPIEVIGIMDPIKYNAAQAEKKKSRSAKLYMANMEGADAPHVADDVSVDS